MAKILLVEDMASVRKSIAKILTDAGHTVSQAGDGAEGADKLRRERPDLAVVDVILPQQDGVAVMAAARNGQGPKVLAMSGGGESVDPQDALALAEGMSDAWLKKPFGREILLKRVNDLLGGGQ